MAYTPVFKKLFTVIRSQNDEGIVCATTGFEKAEQPSQLCVELANARIVEFFEMPYVGLVEDNSLHLRIDYSGLFRAAEGTRRELRILEAPGDVGIREIRPLDLPCGAVRWPGIGPHKDALVLGFRGVVGVNIVVVKEEEEWTLATGRNPLHCLVCRPGRGAPTAIVVLLDKQIPLEVSG